MLSPKAAAAEEPETEKLRIGIYRAVALHTAAKNAQSEQYNQKVRKYRHVVLMKRNAILTVSPNLVYIHDIYHSKNLYPADVSFTYCEYSTMYMKQSQQKYETRKNCPRLRSDRPH